METNLDPEHLELLSQLCVVLQNPTMPTLLQRLGDINVLPEDPNDGGDRIRFSDFSPPEGIGCFFESFENLSPPIL